MRREEDQALVDPAPPLARLGDGDELVGKGARGAGKARESYTPPEEAYRMAKNAGMDFVTLTDHETIEGALTLPCQSLREPALWVSA